jgi:hypothetical protein
VDISLVELHFTALWTGLSEGSYSKFIDLLAYHVILVRPGIADSNSNLLIGIGTIYVTQLCSYLLLDTVHRQR